MDQKMPSQKSQMRQIATQKSSAYFSSDPLGPHLIIQGVKIYLSEDVYRELLGSALNVTGAIGPAEVEDWLDR